MEAEALKKLLVIQKDDFLSEGNPNVATRLDRLKRLETALLLNEEELVRALADDFGVRSLHATRQGDVLGSIAVLRHHQEYLQEWMLPEKVRLPFSVEETGTHAEVIYRPLGVVGAVVPWNGPLLMSVLALAGAISAGNRCMLKVPELTPRTSALIQDLLGKAFSQEEVVVVQGNAEVGAAFCTLPFDHLLFTGASAIAREVMRSASAALVPVTLELGGRNPVFVSRSADMMTTARRIVVGKMASAGQVCVSPDYVLVPKELGEAFCQALQQEALNLYPALLGNDDYTSIISDRHFSRLKDLLDDAKQHGASVMEVNPHGSSLWESEERKFPLCIVRNGTEKMKLLSEEAFGPLLTVVEYEDSSSALKELSHQPSALSAYYFGEDDGERELFLDRSNAGNVVINDVRCQLFYESLPFGGIGSSGMGRYRGREGFRRFSNPKTVLYQRTSESFLARQRPPFQASTKEATIAQIAALKNLTAK